MALSIETEKGDSRLCIYLSDITQADVKVLCEAVADLLVANGLGNSEEDIVSIVTAGEWQWPASEEDMIAAISADTALIILPGVSEEDIA